MNNNDWIAKCKKDFKYKGFKFIEGDFYECLSYGSANLTICDKRGRAIYDTSVGNVFEMFQFLKIEGRI